MPDMLIFFGVSLKLDIFFLVNSRCWALAYICMKIEHTPLGHYHNSYVKYCDFRGCCKMTIFRLYIFIYKFAIKHSLWVLFGTASLKVVLKSIQNLCFIAKEEEYIALSCEPQLYYIKNGYKWGSTL